MTPPTATKPCSNCNKLMILHDTGRKVITMKTTVPDRFAQEWWCNCGNREPAPERWIATHDQLAKIEWDRVNVNETKVGGEG